MPDYHPERFRQAVKPQPFPRHASKLHGNLGLYRISMLEFSSKQLMTPFTRLDLLFVVERGLGLAFL